MRRCLPLLLLALHYPSARAAEPAAKPTDEDAAEFADQLLEVSAAISKSYFIEMPQGRLIDRAVRGLYFRRFGAEAPSEMDERLQKADDMRVDELRNLLIDVRKDVQLGTLLGDQFVVEEMSNNRYLDLALEEMCKHLEETAVVYGNRRFNLGGELPPAAVGVRLRTDPTTGLIEVITPLLDGPAYKAGIRAGDLIKEITVFDQPNGEPLKEPKAAATKGMSAAAALRSLTGEEGTKVRLVVQRPGVEKENVYTLTRHWVKKEAVYGFRRKEDAHWDYWIDPERKLAYVRITLFTPENDALSETTGAVKTAMDALQKDGLKGVVLDLRFTKGGLLTSVVDTAELFLKKADVIASVRGHGRAPDEIRSQHEGSFLGFPVVCLVNGETARVAEVFAACLQDHQRAVVMGERSAGDCGIRNLRRLNNLEGLLFITSASLYRPSGKKLYRAHVPGADDDEWGVKPDAKYVLDLPAEERQALAEHLDRQTYIPPADQYGKKGGPPFKDRQLEMALAYLRSLGEKP